MYNKHTIRWVSVALLTACAQQADEGLEAEDRDPMAVDGKADQWNKANNPTYVDSNFLYKIDQLPVAGSTVSPPIPGDYWAIVNDNINNKWDGASSMSASAKYGKVFGFTDTEEQVSKDTGIKSNSWRKTCKTDADCEDQMDGSACGTSYDGKTKACIPTWWGICHGWSPFALSEAAPVNPVTRTASDGTQVTFYPGDLEGLGSDLYTEVPTKFLSSRCNKEAPPTDSLGRVVDGDCRDMNAGSFHILATNMLGLYHKGFVVDQTLFDQVWNQPVWKYTVTNAVNGKVPEITKQEAVAKLGLDESLTSLLPTTTIKANEQKSGSWTAPSAGTFKVKLTGTGDSDLYVKVGAAPTTDAYDCAPYTDKSVEECDVQLTAGQQVFWLVNGYAESSAVQLAVGQPGQAGTYSYDTTATRFFYVEMDFTFITESSPARTSHVDQADKFAETKHYTYVLEADDYGNVIGGEWTDASKVDHPDFAWFPTGTPSEARAGGEITYANVKGLLNDAANAPSSNTDDSVVIDHKAIDTSSGWNSIRGPLTVPQGYSKVTFAMTGTGAAQLYIGKKGVYPTIYSYACKSATAGTASQTCTIPVSFSGGTYWVRARSKTAGTTVTVTAHLSK